MAKYIVTNVQTWDTGAITTPTYAYDNHDSALAKYYDLCSTAATTTLPISSVILMTDECFVLKTECFKHEVQPEPEPEEETTEEETTE